MKEIPLLTANDVELRVGSIQQTSYGTYATLLVYKDARCDMRILDETFGMMNWKREHCVINGALFCTVSVWDEEKQQWIGKMDVGVPSNTESTKGESSDSFKRSCFVWKIGRELYSAPEIRIKLQDKEITMGNNGKPKTYAKFFVKEMEYDKANDCFSKFLVVDKDGIIRFDVNNGRKRIEPVNAEPKPDTPIAPFEPHTSPAVEFPWATDSTATCSECGAVIKSSKVISFAQKRFGTTLCYGCQQKRS